mmetsp:Transcript_32307/g.63626  ORF Transcript_32307/g.63626 Transcript_32307/m.63626 type:complete len:138 (-) Transcript_32307:447-860(-)
MQRYKQQKRQQEDQKPNEKPQKQTDKNASLLRKQKCPRQGLTTLAANGATDAACAAPAASASASWKQYFARTIYAETYIPNKSQTWVRVLEQPLRLHLTACLRYPRQEYWPWLQEAPHRLHRQSPHPWVPLSYQAQV